MPVCLYGKTQPICFSINSKGFLKGGIFKEEVEGGGVSFLGRGVRRWCRLAVQVLWFLNRIILESNPSLFHPNRKRASFFP